jgi:hypothetical protein
MAVVVSTACICVQSLGSRQSKVNYIILYLPWRNGVVDGCSFVCNCGDFNSENGENGIYDITNKRRDNGTYGLVISYVTMVNCHFEDVTHLLPWAMASIVIFNYWLVYVLMYFWISILI